MNSNSRLSVVAAVLATLTISRAGCAWLLHEHVRITAAAVESTGNLDALQAAWSSVYDMAPMLCARSSTGSRAYEIGAGQRLCTGIEGLTALAADHSCSPGDLLGVLRTAWAPRVLLESESVRAEIDAAFQSGDEDGAKRRDALRQHDINLQLIDPDYATRAKSTLGHFQLLREPGDSLDEYLERATGRYDAESGGIKGQSPNALGYYMVYHAAAIGTIADALSGCTLSGAKVQSCDQRHSWGERREKLLRAILAEALAIHFLEDTFPSGHVVGAVGNVALRKGTHDHYAQKGTLVQPWCGIEGAGNDSACPDYVAYGEGFMDQADVTYAKLAVRQSLVEFMAAARDPADSVVAPWMAPTDVATLLMETDACKASTVPLLARRFVSASRPTALHIPRAGTRQGGVERFNSAVGWFWAPNYEVAARMHLVGLRRQPYVVDVPSRLQVGLDAGVLLDGLISGRSDGVVSAGVLTGASQNPVYGSWAVGAGARLQLPFAFFPGDAILVAPALGLWDAIADDNALTNWALWAADGGVLRLERRVLLGRGWSFQIVAGRRAAVVVSFDSGNKGLENLSFSGRPGVWQLQFPIVVVSTSHVTKGVLGYDAECVVGYDASWARQAPERVAERDYLSATHGLYVSWSVKARRNRFW